MCFLMPVFNHSGIIFVKKKKKSNLNVIKALDVTSNLQEEGKRNMLKDAMGIQPAKFRIWEMMREWESD